MQARACYALMLPIGVSKARLKSVHDALEERVTSEMSARLAALQVEQVGVKKPNRRAPRPNQSQRRGKKKKEAREQTQTPEDANCATARSGLKAGAGRCELRYARRPK